MFARTFVQAERLVATTRGGPPIGDTHRWTLCILSKGKVIDDCFTDDVPDEVLDRYLDGLGDIRIELTMTALNIYERSSEDVADIHSRPRIAQTAAE